MWENLDEGVRKDESGDVVWRVILLFWHDKHCRDHSLQSLRIPGHTYLCETSRTVAELPG